MCNRPEGVVRHFGSMEDCVLSMSDMDLGGSECGSASEVAQLGNGEQRCIEHCVPEDMCHERTLYVR